jgi:tRNA (guanine37-N1)-methyltransferase
MRIDIVSLFPEMFAGPFDASIIGRARESGVLEIAVHNPRDYTEDKHHVADDYAYGGGPGLVMKPEPLFACVEAVRTMASPAGRTVLLTPQGRLLDHEVAAELALEARLIVICGHYEGVDERVREYLADDEISIGDYVLSGGEPAAIVLVDAVARHQPGVLGSDQSLEEESHAQGLLEYPQYTRPAEFRGMAVPQVLLSGHHEEIAAWRRRQSIERTAKRRPDLLARAELSAEERRMAREAAGDPHSSAPELFRVIMPVPDMERGVAYYAAVLAQPGVLVAPNRHYFYCGATILAVVGPGEHSVEFRPNVEHVYFAVADLNASFDAVQGAGGQWVDDRIRKRPWGEKSFYARDPFGNPICFVDEKTVFTGKEEPR